MCDHYTPCPCLWPKSKKHRYLTLLLLDCWQREYDKRPYRNFRFSSNDFEVRMGRPYDAVKDFMIILQFLRQRHIRTVILCGLQVVPFRPELVESFVEVLMPMSRIELKFMELPTVFFEELQRNAARMHVKELSFEGTPVKTADVEALQQFLYVCKTLRYLNMAACSVDQCNFALLADGIHKSTSIRGFNCSRLLGNLLTLDTSKIVHTVSSLIWQNKLEEIEIQHCEFQARDMEIFAEFMANENSKLLKLNLAFNIIACDGAEYLFRAIAHSGTLTHLNIAGNELGSHGGEVVAKYLSSCFRLQALNISYNAIGYEAVNAILTTLKKCVKLTEIKLYGNMFNKKSANVLRRLLDARVFPQDSIDITVTYDESLMDYRIIPYY